MATKTEVKATKEKQKKVKAFDPNEQMKERVPYMAFKDDGPNTKDDIVVIVNGSNFIIQKEGNWLNIPRYVLTVLESKDRELRTANKYIEGC